LHYQFIYRPNRSTMSNVDDIDDNLNDVRDLVEPVARPRIRTWVLEPWRRRKLVAGGDDDGYFRELQLVGSDGAAGSDDILDGGGGAVVPSWLDTVATTEECRSSSCSSNNADAAAANRFRSFLLRRRRDRTVVVWLSPSHFVACRWHTATSRCAGVSEWARAVLELHLYVTVSGDTYEIGFGCAVAGAGGAGAGVGAGADDRGELRSRAEKTAAAASWARVLGALVALSPLVTSIVSHLDSGRCCHVGCLEAIASAAPPPEGRTLQLSLGSFLPVPLREAAARVVAFHTHPDTTLDIDMERWGRTGAAVLAEAVRTSRCPKRLHLSGVDKLGMVEPLADALRVARSVEELDLRFFTDARRESRQCVRRMQDAIGNNVGLRTLTVMHSARVDSPEVMKEWWTSVLRSPTLTSVNVQVVVPRGAPPRAADRRSEVARHVADLLRSNRVVMDLRYHPDLHDADIMEAHAVPLLQWNRLRIAARDANRCLAGFLGSGPVRRHPLLRYHLLRNNVGTLVHHLRISSPSSRRSEEDGDRKRARRDGPSPLRAAAGDVEVGSCDSFVARIRHSRK
jgi:hypothetical protein